jgi:hypothetical protein
MIPATFVYCNAWIIPEGMKSGDENFNSPDSIDIVLAEVALFEVHHHKKAWPENYPVYRIQSLDG